MQGVKPELRAALGRTAVLVCLGLVPAAALGTMFLVGLTSDSLVADFHHELYPQSKLMTSGHNPYPEPDWNPLAAPNFIWPPLAAYVVAPLTLLPIAVADVVMAVAGIALLWAAIWLVGVRDWRVYGVFTLWPQVTGEMRMGHLTPLLVIAAAAAWRWRDTRGAPGAAVGLATAVKLLVWPLMIWLVATRRARDALIAVSAAAVSALFVLPFLSPEDYVRMLANLGRVFDQDSYTVFAVLVQAGAPEPAARAAGLAIGAALLLGTWRYRSFTLAIAASLVLSPIVWLDYFALAAVPLAIARPRLSWVWFVPLATWGLSGAGIGIGGVATSLRPLLVFGVVLTAAFLAEQSTASATPVSALRSHGLLRMRRSRTT